MSVRSKSKGGGRDPELACIHIGCKALGLDDEARHDLQERVTGKRSAADMSAEERGPVLAELERLGWTPARKGPGLEPRRDLRFVFVLWGLLAKAGCVQPGRSALNAFISGPKFRAKWGEAPTDLRFLTADRAHDVIEALKDFCRREGVELEGRR